MDWQGISVITRPEAVEAIADLFYRLGAGGAVIEDPDTILRMTKSGQWDAYELSQGSLNQTYPVVRGYLPVNEELPEKLEKLKTGLAEIALRLGQEPYKTDLITVKEEDWANSWKAYFKPLKISPKIVIRPTWEPYTAREGEVVLDLDPGMAFGTGSHVTTVMCVRLLEKYIRPGNRVIDVGTGTGILAMSAACLGAKEALALDYDPVAVKVARENVRQNCLEDQVRVKLNDLLSGLEIKADLITANIIAAVIVRLLPQAKSRLCPGGVFIVSGIIEERKADVTTAAKKLGFVLLEERKEEDWIAQVWKAREC